MFNKLFFNTFIIFTTLNSVQGSMIVLYGSCDEGLFNVLHEVHSAVVNHSPLSTLGTRREDVCYVNRPEVSYLRQYRNNTCSWMSDDTIAILVVSETNTTEKDVMKSADRLNMPYLIVSAPDICTCGNGSLPSNQTLALDALEEAVFDYLQQEHLEDVLVVHRKGSSAGLYLSMLLNSAAIRVTHLELADNYDFFRKIENFFDAWNLTSLRIRQRLVSLDVGQEMDVFIKKLVEITMENVRVRFLVVDSPKKWMKRLSTVMAYEVDIVVISSEKVALKQCPVAVEVLPYQLHSKRSTNECKALSFQKKSKGESLLLDVRDDISRCCVSPRYNQYTIWKNFASDVGMQTLKPVGIWSPSLGFLGTEIIDFTSIELRIAVLKYPPYVIINETKGDEIVLEECVLTEILKHLVNKINLKYKLVAPADTEFGFRTASGKWTGAIGMVLEGEADMVPFLTITSRRTRVVDFSTPVASTYYGMLVATPSEPPRTFIFLRPFTKEVWITTMVAAMIMSIVLNQIHVRNLKFSGEYDGKKGLAKYTNCLWCIFCPMVQQSGIHLPESVSARIILSTWCLALLVIVSTYSAKLIAFLAFPEAKWILQTVQDLADHKSVLLMIDEGCPLLEDFYKSQVGVFKKIREVYLDNPKRGLTIKKSQLNIADYVATGRVVFVDDVNYLTRIVGDDYQKMGKCRITIAPERFSRMTTAIGFRRGSSIMATINREIKKMGESGILNHWKSKYGERRDECLDVKTTIGGSYEEVGYSDVQGAFNLLILGVAASVGILAFEIMRQRLCYFKRHYYKSVD